MKAYKVTEIGRLNVLAIPEVKKYKIVKMTKSRVYFLDSFENIETYDVFLAHKWFADKKEAISYAKDILKSRIARLEETVKSMKEKLNESKTD